MQKTLLVKFSLVCWCLSVSGQYVIKDGTELLSLQKVPMEKAYVDHTGPLVFSGEYLYYAIYCFNAQNNNPTNISKVGYVVLVNEAKEKVFEHKLKLDKGIAKGDFFVSTEVPSGKYKLLAYTQWMKNSGLAQVFQDDIVIINPYLADQSALLQEASDKRKSPSKTTEREFIGNSLDSAIISVGLDKVSYEPREKIQLSVNNYKGPLGVGIYTLKVKRKEEIAIKPFMDANNYARMYFNADKQLQQGVGDPIFLPEQRGELFFGSVVDSITREPIKDVPVIVSIPGKDFILKFSRTDQNGNFYTYLRKDYKNPLAVVQVADQDQSYYIEKGKVNDLDFSALTFSEFTLSEEDGNYIKERSIRNQIENQFFASKPDSILQGKPIDPFDGGIPEVLYLDDYTRFATFGETLVEVVKFAGYRNGGKNPDYIKISQDFKTFNEAYNDFPAIVLVDGVFIPNHEHIKTLDARQIKKISLIRDQFVLGGKQYQGMMAIDTNDGNYVDTFFSNNARVFTFTMPLAEKNYFKQYYGADENVFSRIPDYRRLLFWLPELYLEGRTYNFEFFASDLEGEYEVIFNGFTSYGKPITVSKTFQVGNIGQ